MSPRQGGLTVNVGALWAGAWALWIAAGAALPVPPWRAADVLAHEERVADSLAAAPLRAPAWSMDVGETRQSRALGRGWSVNEAFVDQGRRRSFVWVEGSSAEIRFSSPGWPDSHLALAASPLDSLAPLTVGLAVDGEERGEVAVASTWTIVHARLGRIEPGPHVLALLPRKQGAPPGESRSLSLAVDGVAIGEGVVGDPARDRGVFAGWLRAGLDDRPALFVSTDAAVRDVPPGSVRCALSPDLVAWYGFGRGGAAGGAIPFLEAVHGLVAAGLVVLLTGLTGATLLGARGAARVGVALGLSTVDLVLAFMALRICGLEPGPVTVSACLTVLGGLPLVHPKGRGAVHVPWRALLPAAAALAALTFFAAEVVPALEDQDMEVQATAHGLATRQSPLALTSRGTTYFFAHPPLLHLWEAGAFALSGRLGRVAYYGEAARRAQAVPFVEPDPAAPLAKRPHYEEWKTLLRRFLAEPHLWPTRQVNVLLAALAVGLLADLAAAASASTPAGVALAAVLVTFPEFLVRGAYGGYFASTALLALLVLAALGERAGPPALMTMSALAFLANQKGLLVPAAHALSAPRGSGMRRFVPLAGALLGAAAYALYGLGLDAGTFLYDFVKEHVVRRLAPSDLRLAADPTRWYPSIPQLWREFAARYGVLFMAWAAVGVARGLRSSHEALRAAAASVVLGAIVFSATDWRQTKHLSLLAAPALLAISGVWPEVPNTRRLALAAAFLLVLINLWTAWPLLSSFESLRPSTIW